MSMKQDRRQRPQIDLSDAYLAHRLSTRFEVRDEIQPLLERAFPQYRFQNPFMVHGQYVYEMESGKEEDVAATWVDDRTPTDIVMDDLGLLEDCDLLVAYIGGALNVGTPAEIFYNSHILGRETILVFNQEDEDARDLMHHPWLQALADEVYTLEDIRAIAKDKRDGEIAWK